MHLTAPLDCMESIVFAKVLAAISLLVFWCLVLLFAYFILYNRQRKIRRFTTFRERVRIALLMLAACLQLYVLFTQLRVINQAGDDYGTASVAEDPGDARSGALGAIHKFYMAHRFRIWAHVCLVVAELVACYLAIKLTAPAGGGEEEEEFSDDEERMPLLGEV